MTDRDEIFANFQACTGLEDVEHCIAVLEQHNWDLNLAIASVLDGQEDIPQDIPIIPPPDIHNEIPPGPIDFAAPPIASDWPSIFERFTSDANMMDMMGGFDQGPSSGASQPSQRIRMLCFDVQYRGQIYPVVLQDSSSVAVIKECLAAQLNVNKADVRLNGFKMPITDWTILRDLHLPKNTVLTMTVAGQDGEAPLNSASLNQWCADESMYELQIKDVTTSKLYQLHQAPTRTVGQVKLDVAGLTGIPTSRQIWTGAFGSPGVTGDTLLRDTTLDPQVNILFVREASPTSAGGTSRESPSETHVVDNTGSSGASGHKPTSRKPYTSHVALSDDEDDTIDYPLVDVEDLDSQYSRTKPLIPEYINDEREASEHFRHVFTDRYCKDGVCLPFYVGTLDDAIKDVLYAPINIRRPLFIYLHHDQSILSNIFCTQILCNIDLVTFFVENDYIIWPWDMTNSINKNRMIAHITQHLGSFESTRISSGKPDSFPLLLMISNLESGSFQLMMTIDGSQSLDEVLSQLWQARLDYMDRQAPEVQAAGEREAREVMRREQDKAYEESLRLDQEKERQRIQEENERQQQTTQEQEERRTRQEKAEQARSRLPAEPEATTDRTSVANIRIKCPSGDFLMRRFNATDTLGNLIDWLESLGFGMEEHKVITTYPRRDISAIDDLSKSMAELKMVPQETLIIESK